MEGGGGGGGGEGVLEKQKKNLVQNVFDIFIID